MVSEAKGSGRVGAYDAALRDFAGTFDAADLMSAAARATGLSDWGGQRWHEDLFRANFGALCDAIEEEAALSARGRSRAHSRLQVMLCSRLLYIEARKTGNGGTRLAAPIIGTGMPRAGTTFLHGLLAQDPGNMIAATVEAAMPACPDPELYQRILGFQGFLDPAVVAIHPAGALMPEECIFLQEGICNTLYGVYFDVPSYSAATAGQAAHAYEWQRGVMQLLQAGKAGERWVLKGPGHMFSWDELRLAFPDAQFYINHRDPAKVVPSIASLFRALRGRFSDAAADPVAIGAQQLAAWSGTMAACVRRRQARADHDVVDVHYKALIGDPIGTVAMLYDRFGLTIDPSVRDRILRHLDHDRHGKGAAHRYSLAEFGLDEAAIDAAFGEYIDYFGIARERDF